LKWYDQVLLTVYILALAFVSVLLMLAAPGWVEPHRWIEDLLGSFNGRLVVLFVGAAFFAVSVRLIIFAFTRRGGGQPVIHETALGDVRISLDAVENLVRKVARGVKGVREIKAVVANGPSGLTADLRAVVSPEVSIPEVAEEIQSSVKQYVRRVVGAELYLVRIEVDNISSEGRRSRIE
jgi:uncharacterized alkaline shock family protein YloU